jgi:hypothetical protein
VSGAIELRDHRGHLVEERNERGQLVYARSSNYERDRVLRMGRTARTRLHHSFRAHVTGRKWHEPYGMFAGHAKGVPSLSILTPLTMEPSLDPADRKRRRRPIGEAA